MNQNLDFILSQTADDLIYELEKELIGEEYNSLDQDTLFEIRDIWKEKLVITLRTALLSLTYEEPKDDVD